MAESVRWEGAGNGALEGYLGVGVSGGLGKKGGLGGRRVLGLGTGVEVLEGDMGMTF